MKTLIFEGAGWADADTSKATDVGNCRIRTRLRNNSGRVIYLEISCCHFDNPKIKPIWAKGLNYVTNIDFCFYDDSTWDVKRSRSSEFDPLLDKHFEYNKNNILKFVNKNLDCSFDDMIVYNNGEVRVHDTKKPLCDCAQNSYIPYNEKKYNISELKNIKPLFFLEDKGFAEYRVSYDVIKNIFSIRKWARQKHQDIRHFRNYHFYAKIHFDSQGNITQLEISASEPDFCNVSLGIEEVPKILANIKEFALTTK